MNEHDIQNLIRIELSKMGIMNFRNNTGMGWAGQSTNITRPMNVFCYPGDVVVRKARPLRAGLCEGSSDIIGIKTITVTQDMVGQKIGVFIAPEVKTKTGKASQKQQKFIDNINKAGGIAGVVRCVDDVYEYFK